MASGTIFAGSLVLTNQPAGQPVTTIASSVDFDFDFSQSTGNAAFEEHLSGSASTDCKQPGYMALRTPALGDSVVRQSYRQLHAPSGISRVAVLPVACSEQDAQIQLRFGLFDDALDKGDFSGTDQSGLFLQAQGSALCAVRRLHGQPDEVVPAADFNGEAAAAYTFDPTKLEVFIIELDSSCNGLGTLSYLRAGCIKRLHTFKEPVTGFLSSHLPVRYEMLNRGGPSSLEVQTMNGSALTRGPSSALGRTSVSRGLGASPRAIGTTRTPVMSLRLGGQKFSAGLDRVNTFSEGTVLWEVLYGGTLQSSSFTADSVQLDTSATAVSGGLVIKSAFTCKGAGVIVLEGTALVADMKGDGIPVTLCATSLSGAATVFATWQWTE